MHHKGDAKIGIKLKKDYEICTNGKCQKRVRNLTKKQDVLESNAGGDKAQKTIEVNLFPFYSVEDHINPWRSDVINLDLLDLRHDSDGVIFLPLCRYF